MINGYQPTQPNPHNPPETTGSVAQRPKDQMQETLKAISRELRNITLELQKINKGLSKRGWR